MKIYCSRRKPEFEDFVGKDVWVKCYLAKRSDVFGYIKVFSYDKSSDTLVYYKIDGEFIEPHIDWVPLSEWEIDDCIELIDNPTEEDLLATYGSSWVISEPYEILNDADMKELILQL